MNGVIVSRGPRPRRASRHHVTGQGAPVLVIIDRRAELMPAVRRARAERERAEQHARAQRELALHDERGHQWALRP